MNAAQSSIWVTSEWEHNGRDDSDWYRVEYSREHGLRRIETGTTRFADAMSLTYREPTTREGELYEEALELAVDAIMRDVAETYPHVHSTQHEIGEIVTVLRSTSAGIREVCPNCGGTRKWQNPNRANDSRPCFACQATGYATRPSSTKAKVKAGDRVVLLGVQCDNFGGHERQTALIRTVTGETIAVGAASVKRELTADKSARLRELVRGIVMARPEQAFYSLFPSSYTTGRVPLLSRLGLSYGLLAA
jgi:hypothetical protein